MPFRLSLLLLAGLTACAPTAGPLTAERTAAIRDSVQAFLKAYSADVSAPPIGTKARDAVARFMAPDVVMSTDLGSDEPVVLHTIDSMIPPEEVVSQPAWIRGTRMEYRNPLITPLAPGLAMVTSRYAEVVTDTTGAVTELPGAQLLVVRNGPSGWRITAVQSAHPVVTQQRQAALGAKFAGTK